MSLPPIYSEREIITYTGGGLITETADLVNEIPLTVFLNDLELVTLYIPLLLLPPNTWLNS